MGILSVAKVVDALKAWILNEASQQVSVSQSAMVMTASLHVPSPSLFPLLSSKTSHFLSSCPSEQNPLSQNSYHCSFPTVSSRQSSHLSTFGKWVLNSQTVRPQASLDNKEAMVPPYNVLITGSTKGPQPHLPNFFILLLRLFCRCLFWCCHLSFLWVCLRFVFVSLVFMLTFVTLICFLELIACCKCLEFLCYVVFYWASLELLFTG